MRGDKYLPGCCLQHEIQIILFLMDPFRHIYSSLPLERIKRKKACFDIFLDPVLVLSAVVDVQSWLFIVPMLCSAHRELNITCQRFF